MSGRKESCARSRGFAVAAFICLGLTLAMVGSAQSTSADLRGIFVYSNNIPQATPSELTQLAAATVQPGVDGIATVFGWADLEPALGKYQWTVLDQWIA